MARIVICSFVLFAMASAMVIQPISDPNTDPTVDPISPLIDILPYPYYPCCCCNTIKCYCPIYTTNVLAKPAKCFCPILTAEAQTQ